MCPPDCPAMERAEPPETLGERAGPSMSLAACSLWSVAGSLVGKASATWQMEVLRGVTARVRLSIPHAVCHELRVATPRHGLQPFLPEWTDEGVHVTITHYETSGELPRAALAAGHNLSRIRRRRSDHGRHCRRHGH